MEVEVEGHGVDNNMEVEDRRTTASRGLHSALHLNEAEDHGVRLRTRAVAPDPNPRLQGAPALLSPSAPRLVEQRWVGDGTAPPPSVQPPLAASPPPFPLSGNSGPPESKEPQHA